MIDTHAHINTEKFNEDRDEVIKRALDSGVEKIIIPAIEPKDFDSLLKLVQSKEELFCGIGIHPHNVKDVGEDELKLVNSLQKKDSVVATGEIGLDYFYDFAPKEKQKDIFSKQIEIAAKNNNPIIVHNRETDSDIISIIKEQQNGELTGVIHCFSSGVNELKQFLDIGMNVSFTGNITFKKMDLDSVIKYVPNDRFMIETDSPYMAPVPNRGKRNEPAFVRFVAEKIAQVKNLTFDEVVKMSTNTAKKLFGLLSIILFISFNQAFAQDDEFYDDEYYDDEYYDDEYVEDRFQKTLGLGFTVGTTTIVETRYLETGNQELSQESILALGGEISYAPFSFMHLRLGYVYSVNEFFVNEARRNRPDEALPDPNIHQLIELSAMFTPNAGARVEFFGEIGFTYFLNKFNSTGETITDQKPGINFAIGALINIYETNFGLFALSAEWKVNWEIGRTQTQIFDAGGVRDAEISNFFSIPRATIYFFPKF